MPAIVEFPRVVREAVDEFRDLFSCEPQRRHFAEYLTGLMVAANKTVTGINGEFVDTTDQSCLNRFITGVQWDEQAVNQRRLELLQRDPTTRYSDQGVIALDDTLIDHDGKFIKDVGWFWDHAEERHKIAHDYLFVNYVCTSGKHYPLEFRRFKKRDQCEATGETFHDHTELFCQLVDWVCEREIPGDFTFDCYFTNAEDLNHIHSKQDKHGRPRAYVGDLKFNRKLDWKGQELACRRLGGNDSSGRSQGTAARRSSAMVFHLDVAHSEGESQDPDCHSLESPPRQGSVQDPGYQPNDVGSVSHLAYVPTSLDRHGDLSSGRQATAWHGRLSAPRRPGPDPAHVPGHVGVQSAHVSTAAGPCA